MTNTKIFFSNHQMIQHFFVVDVTAPILSIQLKHESSVPFSLRIQCYWWLVCKELHRQIGLTTNDVEQDLKRQCTKSQGLEMSSAWFRALHLIILCIRWKKKGQRQRFWVWALGLYVKCFDDRIWAEKQQYFSEDKKDLITNALDGICWR